MSDLGFGILIDLLIFGEMDRCILCMSICTTVEFY